METQNRKRQRIAIANTGTEAPSMAILPDELLVRIFHQLDSISRKRIQRVCWRWNSLIQDTSSLHDHIKLDVSSLPRSDDDYENDFQCALRRLRDGHFEVRSIHVIDESKCNTAAPWEDENAQPQPAFFGDENLYTVRDVFGLRYVVLEKVPVEMEWIEYHLLSNEDTWIACVEFHDVTVKRISLKPLLVETDTWHTEPIFYDGLVVEERPVTGIIRPLRTESGYGALMTLLGEKDAPLTRAEKKLFRRTVGTVEVDRKSGAAEALENAMERTTGCRMNPNDILTDETELTPFVKRLIIGAKDMLEFLDLHSQPMSDNDEEDNNVDENGEDDD